MRWNEAEVQAFVSSRVPDWEGSLTYKSHKQHQYKERYFKLCSNILACLRAKKEDFVSVLLLENCEAIVEDKDIFKFCIQFKGGEGLVAEEHTFVATNQRCMDQWLEAINDASYEKKREKLLNMQIKLQERTGIDPLLGTTFEFKPLPEASTPALPKEGPKPSPRPRKEHKSNFTSHLGIQVWEEPKEEERHAPERPVVGLSTPTFRSHVENLIQFDG